MLCFGGRRKDKQVLVVLIGFRTATRRRKGFEPRMQISDRDHCPATHFASFETPSPQFEENGRTAHASSFRRFFDRQRKPSIYVSSP